MDRRGPAVHRAALHGDQVHPAVQPLRRRRQHRRALPPGRGHRRTRSATPAAGGSPASGSSAARPAGPGVVERAAPLESRPARRPRAGDLGPDAGRSRSPTRATAGSSSSTQTAAILAYQVTEDGPFTFLGTFLDIQDRVLCCGERGCSASPSIRTTPATATSSSTTRGSRRRRRRRSRATTRRPRTSNIVDPNTERVLLTIEHSTTATTTAAGSPSGPTATCTPRVGDGGGGGDPLGSGQNLGDATSARSCASTSTPTGGRGALLRDPAEQPVRRHGPARAEEIWAWGLRNPWRISFDRLTGDLFIGDVGQDNREEVNFQLAGSAGGVNYGWPRMEGTPATARARAVRPAASPPHPGLLPRRGLLGHGRVPLPRHGDPDAPRRLRVRRLLQQEDLGSASRRATGRWSRVELLATNLSISTFGEDADGELYVASLAGPSTASSGCGRASRSRGRAAGRER